MLPPWNVFPEARTCAPDTPQWGVSGWNYCLSAAPQAVPQAAGASAGLSAAPQAVPQAAGASVGLSAAPHAVPQAAGASAGLSAAPQAVPQAEAGEALLLLLQSCKLESAMICLPPGWNVEPFVRNFIIRNLRKKKSTHNSITWSQKGNPLAKRVMLHYNKKYNTTNGG